MCQGEISPDEALSHLFGVTILNDFSARDVQGPEMSSGFGPSKGKDFATALGPWITTFDELDISHLEMVAWVNGQEWSRCSSASMKWKAEELIAYASKGETLWPGELLGSGTVGTGSGAEHGKSCIQVTSWNWKCRELASCIIVSASRSVADGSRSHARVATRT